jgi:hypothetical protein
MTETARRRWTAACALATLLLAFGACATMGTRRMDYTTLSSADRVEVRTTDAKVATITDPAKVRHAVEFIRQRQDRWGDRVNPYVPTLVLEFFSVDRRLGGYGIGQDILVALPGDQGFSWRDVSEAEVNTLLKALGIAFPARR